MVTDHIAILEKPWQDFFETEFVSCADGSSLHSRSTWNVEWKGLESLVNGIVDPTCKDEDWDFLFERCTRPLSQSPFSRVETLALEGQLSIEGIKPESCTPEILRALAMDEEIHGWEFARELVAPFERHLAQLDFQYSEASRVSKELLIALPYLARENSPSRFSRMVSSSSFFAQLTELGAPYEQLVPPKDPLTAPGEEFVEWMQALYTRFTRVLDSQTGLMVGLEVVLESCLDEDGETFDLDSLGQVWSALKGWREERQSIKNDAENIGEKQKEVFSLLKASRDAQGRVGGQNG